MKKLLLSLSLLLLSSPLAAASYDDVPLGHEFLEGITYLELQGAADDASDFRPDDPIRRGEAFKILFELLGEDTSQRSNRFVDVPEDAWFAPYARLAQHYDLATGDEFKAHQNLRKIDALDVLLSAYHGGAPIVPNAQRRTLFHDVDPSHPHYEIIHTNSELGILQASPGEYLFPYRKLTRGEFAQLIFEFESLHSEMNGSLSGIYKSDIFADVWEQIFSKFYLEGSQEIDPDALFQAAIKGLLESLEDPYSTYFSPSEATEFTTRLEGTFEGIGAQLIQNDETGQIFITEVWSDSPAESAGLEAGDEILSVDGTPTTDMSVEQVTERIRGAAGTSVTLTVQRDERTLLFTATRAELSLTLESSEILDEEIWYLDIDRFAANIHTRLMPLIRELEDEVPEPTAIVIDLRNNVGGYIQSANFVAGLFVPQFTPLVQLDYGEESETIYNGDTGPYRDIPLYILVNEYSASASEILAATLQENEAATIVGTQSFGKGTAQEFTQYWDGSILKITIAHWLTGKGQSINGVGVTPDIEVDAEVEESAWLDAVYADL